MFEQLFQLFNNSRFQHMFNQIRFPVNAPRCDFGKVNQVKLPQTMVPDRSGRDACSSQGKSVLPIRILP